MVEQYILDEKTSCTNTDSQSDFNFTAKEEYTIHTEILEVILIQNYSSRKVWKTYILHA